MADGNRNTVVLERLPFETDGGAGSRARIGLLVLESDQTLEWEMRALLDFAGVSFYHARLANDTDVTPETLSKMEAELPKAAGLLPRYLGLASLGYGCTSGATIIGSDRVSELLDHYHPGVPVSDPLIAAKAALGVLGVKRLALITPYTPDVTQAMQDKFEEAGITVVSVGSFFEMNDIVVGQISAQSILDAVVRIGSSADVDGVFVSCTSLRASGIIEQAEAKLGKPVTASNHALAWHLLRLACVDDCVDGFGRLFQLPIRDQHMQTGKANL